MSDVELELRAIRSEIEKVLSRMDGRLSPRVAVSMGDAAAAVGLGLTKFSELVKRKEISTFLVDRRRLVRVQELEDWALRQTVPVSVRLPKTKKTVGDRIRARLKAL